MSEITTTFIGRVNGMDVYEVHKDGELIGTNVSWPEEEA